MPLWGVQSPLLTPYQLVSFPGGTKMFQFPPCSFASFGGELFGNPRFNGCLRLPWAYRSLPRPSSLPEPSHPLNGVLTALVFARNYSFYSTHGLINISHFIQEIFLNCICVRMDSARCSAVNLPLNSRPPPRKGGALPLSYEPIGFKNY